MESDLKVGDLVNNKANPREALTITQIDIDKINAICIDKNGNGVTIPLAALEKYIPPKEPQTEIW